MTVSLDWSICPDWGEARPQYGSLKLCPDILLESNAFLNRVISHEWSHFAGFGHGTCPASESVVTVIQPNQMQPNTATSPGCADIEVVKSVYTRRDNDNDQYSPDDTGTYWEPEWCDDDAARNPGALPPYCGDPEYVPGYGDDYNCDGVDDAEQWQDICPNSPILIDVSGDGFSLTNQANGVRFDLNADGIAELLPWTMRNGDDAWLALDRNGNGVIDDGDELFGNNTVQPSSSVPNGFLALAVFDSPDAGGNGNGLIDPADAIFTELRLWQDRNHDGISQPSELVSLHPQINEIALEYREVRRSDRWGNWFRYRASVVGASGRQIGQWAYDVYLAGRLPRVGPRDQ